MENAKAALFRHGEAQYQNLYMTMDKSKFHKDEIENFLNMDFFHDLKNEKIGDMKTLAQQFIEQHQNTLAGKDIVIRTSPFGRTLQTSQIIAKQLLTNDFKLGSISVIDQLQEVKNFERKFFDGCVRGTTIQHNGEIISLDKNITNPNDLNYTEYFFQGGYRQIPHEYLESLGLDHIHSIETYEEITQRSKNALMRVLQNCPENKFVIIVSHQGFTDWILKEYEDYKHGGLKPGEFLVLDSDFGYEKNTVGVS